MADTGACMTPDQCFDEMAVALGVAEPKDTGYTELLDLVKGLKEENEKLKHKEYCLRQDAKGYSPSEVQEYREETEELKEENKKLKEENQELQENLTHTEDNSWDYYGELLKLREENKKLKEENKNLKGGIRALADEMKKMKEENEKLQKVDESDEESDEEDSDEPPDCCEGCGEKFDLQYTMNHADKELREKYDKYFGSEEDDGDLCQICLDSNY